MDTTRADHTSLYSYSKDTTPNLKEISKNGVLFEKAYSPVPLTLPAHISLFTGKDPFEHKIFLNGQFYKPEKDYLPLIFKEKNYSTYAFLSSSILDRVFGISRGFDFYEDKFLQERKCEDTLNIFKEKLKEIKEPFFLWIHFFDPHSPYIPPENYRRKFENPYDGEIAYMDFCLGELFKIIPENTITLIVGDHGELLGEKGEEEHGVLLYEGAVKVPCLLINPEIKNTKIEKPISFKEIYKIIKEYFFEKKTFKEIFEKLEDEPIIMSSLYGREIFGFEPARSVIFKDYKLILYGERNFKLFNLKEDPFEEKDIAKENTKKLRELLNFLKGKNFPKKLEENYLEEGEKILKSLGYLTPSKHNKLKDPEKGVLAEKKVKEAIETISFKNYEEGIRILREVLLEFPEHIEALSALGKTYLFQGKSKDALKVFEKIISLRKGDVTMLLRYGQALLANKEIEKAEKIFKNCLDIHPRLMEAYGELTKIYSSKKEKKEILKLYDKAKENEIEEPFLLLEIAKIREEEKKYDESFLLYHKVYKYNPLNVNVLLSLGRLSFLKENPKMALFYLSQALKIEPFNFEANYKYGLILYKINGKKEEALIYLYKALNNCIEKNICEEIKKDIDLIQRNGEVLIK